MQDIWQNVFAHCHKQEVGRCASVCKEWRQLSESDAVWMVLYKRDLKDLSASRSLQRGWKILYRDYRPQVYRTYGDPFNHKVEISWGGTSYPDGLWRSVYHKGSPYDSSDATSFYNVLLVGNPAVGKKEFIKGLARHSESNRGRSPNPFIDPKKWSCVCYVGNKLPCVTPEDRYQDKFCSFVNLNGEIIDQDDEIPQGKKIHVVIFAFSLTSQFSLDSIRDYWAKLPFDQDSVKILVGTHLDCTNEKILPFKEGHHLAQALGATYFEVGCTEEFGLVDVIVHAARGAHKVPQPADDTRVAKWIYDNKTFIESRAARLRQERNEEEEWLDDDEDPWEEFAEGVETAWNNFTALFEPSNAPPSENADNTNNEEDKCNIM